MKRTVLILFALLSLITSAAMATDTPDLYQACVVVKSRSKPAWRVGVRKALADVMVKVSGQMINTADNASLSQAELNSMVQRFSYQSKKQENDTEQLIMSVRFDPHAVNKILSDRKIAVWNTERPVTLLWLAVAPQDERAEIVTRDQNPQIMTIIDETTEKRGLPMAVPMMDLTDISRVTLHDVWNFNTTMVQDATKRYQAPAFMMTKVTFGDDKLWHLRSLWVMKEQQCQWELSHENLMSVLSANIDRLADEMWSIAVAQKQMASKEQQILRIIGVNGIDEFTKVVDYLKELAPVKSVAVQQIESDSVVVALSYGGDLPALTDAIISAHDHCFHQVECAKDNADAAVAMVFEWQNNESNL
ncbi:MAG: DUF2066 domain-containing protein [Coxiellaceae bacterium]|nr:DUF2066 domain-containing protein [Coxiellaceae bacterium]